MPFATASLPRDRVVYGLASASRFISIRIIKQYQRVGVPQPLCELQGDASASGIQQRLVEINNGPFNLFHVSDAAAPAAP
jgi:hypothetical protein